LSAEPSLPLEGDLAPFLIRPHPPPPGIEACQHVHEFVHINFIGSNKLF
jgi:hypothetical protein